MNLTTTDEVAFRICTTLSSTRTIVIGYPSRGYFLSDVALVVVNSILVISTVILNGMSVLTIYKCSQLKEKVCYFLIFLQSMLDLITGLVSLPLFTYVIASEITGTGSCTLNGLFTQVISIPTALSLSTLSAMNFERYLGILYPFFHHTEVTKKRLLRYICFLSVVILTGFILWFNSSEIFGTIMAFIVIAFIATFVFVYTRIFLVARKSLCGSDGNIADVNSLPNVNRKLLLKELKLAKTSFMVVFCFTLCFLPVPLISFTNVKHNLHMARATMYWSITTVMLNSSLNSLIFFWSKPMLRKEAMRILKHS